jgi:hypothetical protein
MCAQKWYKQTYAEFVTDPQKKLLLPLLFYIDETGTDVFQRYPLEPLMFTLGILRNFIPERSSSWRHAGFIPKVAKAKTLGESLQLYFDGPLPPTIKYSADKSKFLVVSCFMARANWAHLFYEWANSLPGTEIQMTRPDSDEDSDTDAESVDCDEVSDSEDASSM